MAEQIDGGLLAKELEEMLGCQARTHKITLKGTLKLNLHKHLMLFVGGAFQELGSQ